MKKVLTVLLILNCFFASDSAWAKRAIRVVDGDKMILDNAWKVRLYGIDAPDAGQPYYTQARKYLIQVVLNQDLELDCYHHLQNWRVCLVMIQDKDVSSEMVNAGFAFDYPKYSHGIYAKAQKKAKMERRGVWNLEGGGLRPWEFRKLRAGQSPILPKTR